MREYTTYHANDKILKLVLTVFSILGVAFIVIAVLAFISAKNKQETYVETTAVITDFDRDDYPYVAYTVYGKEYETRLSYSSSTMRLGQEMKIAYDPENPYDVMATGFGAYLISIVFGFIGIIFVIISGSIIVVGKRKKKQEEDTLGYDPTMFE